MKFHLDKAAFQKKLKKEENARLKRIAGGIAKEVKIFWKQIEKVDFYSTMHDILCCPYLYYSTVI